MPTAFGRDGVGLMSEFQSQRRMSSTGNRLDAFVNLRAWEATEQRVARAEASATSAVSDRAAGATTAAAAVSVEGSSAAADDCGSWCRERGGVPVAGSGGCPPQRERAERRRLLTAREPILLSSNASNNASSNASKNASNNASNNASSSPWVSRKCNGGRGGADRTFWEHMRHWAEDLHLNYTW
jgi:hypothetical protein